MLVRLARLADAEALRAIYNEEVLHTTATLDLVPRGLATQREWILEHSGAHPAIVAVEAGEIAGFASVAPYRTRPGYSTTVEDSVYVAAPWRRQGVGRLLLGELLPLVARHGFHSVMARVVDAHPASVALHRSLGFTLVGIEREVGRKFGRWRDVALLQCMLSPDGLDGHPG